MKELEKVPTLSNKNYWTFYFLIIVCAGGICYFGETAHYEAHPFKHIIIPVNSISHGEELFHLRGIMSYGSYLGDGSETKKLEAHDSYTIKGRVSAECYKFFVLLMAFMIHILSCVLCAFDFIQVNGKLDGYNARSFLTMYYQAIFQIYCYLWCLWCRCNIRSGIYPINAYGNKEDIYYLTNDGIIDRDEEITCIGYKYRNKIVDLSQYSKYQFIYGVYGVTVIFELLYILLMLMAIKKIL